MLQETEEVTAMKLTRKAGIGNGRNTLVALEARQMMTGGLLDHGSQHSALKGFLESGSGGEGEHSSPVGDGSDAVPQLTLPQQLQQTSLDKPFETTVATITTTATEPFTLPILPPPRIIVPALVSPDLQLGVVADPALTGKYSFPQRKVGAPFHSTTKDSFARSRRGSRDASPLPMHSDQELLPLHMSPVVAQVKLKPGRTTHSLPTQPQPDIAPSSETDLPGSTVDLPPYYSFDLYASQGTTGSLLSQDPSLQFDNSVAVSLGELDPTDDAPHNTTLSSLEVNYSRVSNVQ